MYSVISILNYATLICILSLLSLSLCLSRSLPPSLPFLLISPESFQVALSFGLVSSAVFTTDVLVSLFDFGVFLYISNLIIINTFPCILSVVIIFTCTLSVSRSMYVAVSWSRVLSALPMTSPAFSPLHESATRNHSHYTSCTTSLCNRHHFTSMLQHTQLDGAPSGLATHSLPIPNLTYLTYPCNTDSTIKPLQKHSRNTPPLHPCNQTKTNHSPLQHFP